MEPKRTIRDITMPKRKKRVSTTYIGETEETVERSPERVRFYQGDDRPVRVGRVLILVVSIAVLALVFALSTLFARAAVTVTPQKGEAALNSTFIAKKDAGTGELQFDVMAIEKTVSKTITATETSQVEEKAKGIITIYNEGAAQRFIEETRFETPEKLIFKTGKGVVTNVPAGTKAAPGKIDVTVYAEKAGPEYNIGLTNFVIPGWRETKSPKFNTQYAKSKTEMTGGFSGERSVVPETEKAKVTTELRTDLEARLREQAEGEKTEDFIIFPDAIALTFGEVTMPATEVPGQLTLEQKGTLQAVLFNKKELSMYVAEEVLPDYAGEPIMITNFEELTFAFRNKVATDIPTAQQISVTFSGTPTFEWLVDDTKLADDLGGVHKRDFDAILKNHTGIANAELVIKPFWKRTVPDTTKKIRIEYKDSSLK